MATLEVQVYTTTFGERYWRIMTERYETQSLAPFFLHLFLDVNSGRFGPPPST